MSNSKTVDINVYVSNVSGPVISQQIRIYQRIKGFYGCQGECKERYSKVPLFTNPVKNYTFIAYNIKTIVCSLDKKQIEKMIDDGWLHCSVCRYAFYPNVCPGKTRKFCPCCSSRLKMLRTVLKESTVKKIQNTILISRVGD